MYHIFYGGSKFPNQFIQVRDTDLKSMDWSEHSLLPWMEEFIGYWGTSPFRDYGYSCIDSSPDPFPAMTQEELHTTYPELFI